MSTSEHTEVNDLIGRVFAELGGRATKNEVKEHVKPSLPEHLRDYLAGEGLNAKINGFFRSLGDDGLPQAPAVDGHMHVQLQLLSVEEYKFLVASQMNRGAAARHRASQYADRCLDQHGIRIDIDHPYGEAGAS